ncbi:MAG: PfkB family carbohydrate kinase [Candidatus Latescibacteria bacterium]|jgi:rfaE bifunctional protein kinase chain/domain|nr:PfkB family carbohydrate kinase [Candidatus Latescibacterota bacterium]
MTHSDLQSLLAQFADLTVLVVGDFFLDRYLILDPDLAETSLETGLEARQVTKIRNSPGAAGTVTSNLCALGVGRVRALGVIGSDGHGYDLVAGLRATGVDTSVLLEVPERATPTYTKPILKSTGAELERLDVKNRTPTSGNIEAHLIEVLREAIDEVHGVIALDQVQERNCGVITDRVREELARLGRANPERVLFADSRARIGEFDGTIVKVNQEEAVRAELPDDDGPVDLEKLGTCGRSFSRRIGRPVYITLGPEGILLASGGSAQHIPGIPVPGPLDIVGAGDSVSAGVTSALCAGASPESAALAGVLVSSITVQQVGTTGTASPAQVLQRFDDTFPEGWTAPRPL